MSARTVWNTLGWALYAGLVCLGGLTMLLSLGLEMGRDACQDAACEANYRVWPLILTTVVGVVAVLAGTAVAMVGESRRGRIIVGWPVAGLVGLAGVALTVMSMWHFGWY